MRYTETEELRKLIKQDIREELDKPPKYQRPFNRWAEGLMIGIIGTLLVTGFLSLF